MKYSEFLKEFINVLMTEEDTSESFCFLCLTLGRLEYKGYYDTQHTRRLRAAIKRKMGKASTLSPVLGFGRKPRIDWLELMRKRIEKRGE
jgi:hypothetical protein